MSKQTISIIYVSLCIVLWSIIPIFVKFASTTLDHHQYLFFSSIISFASLFIISLFSKKTHELFSYGIKTYIALFILGFLDFFYYLLLYFGYANANGLEVLIVQYTWPIFIVIFSLILLGEKLTKNKSISLILGFIAVSLVITKGDIYSIDFSNIKVILVVILGAASFALFSVLSKKIKINPINAVTIYFFTASIYGAISVSLFSHFVWPENIEWFYIIINGVFLNGVSYLFWVIALRNGDASFIAPFIFTIPIISAFLLIFTFDEPIYFIYFVALVLIVASGVINSLRGKK